MPEGSEFHTEGTATLKPWEAKVVCTRGTDNRLVLKKCRESAGLQQLAGDGEANITDGRSSICILLTLTSLHTELYSP